MEHDKVWPIDGRILLKEKPKKPCLGQIIQSKCDKQLFVAELCTELLTNKHQHKADSNSQ